MDVAIESMIGYGEITAGTDAASAYTFTHSHTQHTYKHNTHTGPRPWMDSLAVVQAKRALAADKAARAAAKRAEEEGRRQGAAGAVASLGA
jgi:hypothetical protein